MIPVNTSKRVFVVLGPSVTISLGNWYYDLNENRSIETYTGIRIMLLCGEI